MKKIFNNDIKHKISKCAGNNDIKGIKTLLVACDVYRPAAIEQLHVIGEQIDVEVYSEEKSKSP